MFCGSQIKVLNLANHMKKQKNVKCRSNDEKLHVICKIFKERVIMAHVRYSQGLGPWYFGTTAKESSSLGSDLISGTSAKPRNSCSLLISSV